MRDRRPPNNFRSFNISRDRNPATRVNSDQTGRTDRIDSIQALNSQLKFTSGMLELLANSIIKNYNKDAEVRSEP